MGWTTFAFNGTRKEFAYQEFGKEPQHGSIVDLAVVGTVIYIAYKLGENHSKPGKVTALIILTSKQKGYYNFGYKDMDETVGPYEKKCPKKILDLLSPLEELYDDPTTCYAKEWRDGCLAYHNSRKATSTIKIAPGTVIKLEKPLKFSNGVVTDTFTNTKRNHWLVDNYYRVIFNPSRFKFTVIA